VLRAQKLMQTLGDRLVILCGDDSLTLPMIACGARGVISVTSNVLPAEVSRATRLALEGKFDEARRAHLALLPAHDSMFVEANPAPVKYALAMRGLTKEAVRLPLIPVSEGARAVISGAIEAVGRGSR
jgi:4-hydroxy-tetrahydrodipicolinate synthase